jgi:hypothetical protein
MQKKIRAIQQSIHKTIVFIIIQNFLFFAIEYSIFLLSHFQENNYI